jgi:hypothetical protein
MAIQGILITNDGGDLNLKAYYKISNMWFMEETEGEMVCNYTIDVYESKVIRDADIDNVIVECTYNISEIITKVDFLNLTSKQLMGNGYNLASTNLSNKLISSPINVSEEAHAAYLEIDPTYTEYKEI